MTVEQLIAELRAIVARGGGKMGVVIAVENSGISVDRVVTRLNDIALEPRSPLGIPLEPL